MSIVLDTNVLISSLIFGGKPRRIFQKVLNNKIKAITSQYLLTELYEILIKKFRYPPEKLKLLDIKLKKNFKIVYPAKTIKILKDKPDNRVLEAAVEGKCQFIITGDKELLSLGIYKNIKIVNPNKFLLLVKCT